jgi:hypothetical protein
MNYRVLWATGFLALFLQLPLAGALGPVSSLGHAEGFLGLWGLRTGDKKICPSALEFYDVSPSFSSPSLELVEYFGLEHKDSRVVLRSRPMILNEHRLWGDRVVSVSVPSKNRIEESVVRKKRWGAGEWMGSSFFQIKGDYQLQLIQEIPEAGSRYSTFNCDYTRCFNRAQCN